MKIFATQILGGILILFATMSFAIGLTINCTWLFSLNMHWLNLHQATGLSFGQMHEEYMKMVNYIQFPWIGKLKFNYFSSSAHGLQHFADVKSLVEFNNLILLITVPIAVYLLVKLHKNGKLWFLINPIRVIVTVSLVVISLMIVNFDQIFVWFHEIFFRNSYWIFYPNQDPVINMLPDTFFGECFGLFFAIFLAEISIIFWQAKRSLKKSLS